MNNRVRDYRLSAIWNCFEFRVSGLGADKVNHG